MTPRAADPAGAARKFVVADLELARKQHATIYAYLREILASTLSDKDKVTLCAAMQGDRTAARMALDSRNPGAAAAMACAILQSGSDPQKNASLLSSLRVDLGEVLVALNRSGHPQDVNWAKNIVAFLGRSGLPQAEIETLADIGGNLGKQVMLE